MRTTSERNALDLDRIGGIVLIGTHSWTNSAFDALTPRVLLPIAHRPLISYALSWLHEAGIRDAAVCGNRETSTLRHRLLRHVPSDMRVAYHEDPMPRGAAGCMRDAAFASDAETFVVADGTAIPDVDLRDLLATHRSSGAVVTVVVNGEPRRHGNPGLEVPTGIYVFERRAMDLVPARGFCDLKEKLIPQLYRAGHHVVTYRTPSAIPRVLSAATYLAVNEWMVERLIADGEEPDGYTLSGMSLLHSTACIAGDAVLLGPVLVGPGVRIRTGAVVVGPTSIGRDATIERGVLVSRSAVWRRSLIGERAAVDRSILADGSVVAPSERAFRTVKATVRRGQLEKHRTAAHPPSVAAAPGLELRQRIGRLLLGAHLSRSPVRQ